MQTLSILKTVSAVAAASVVAVIATGGKASAIALTFNLYNSAPPPTIAPFITNTQSGIILTATGVTTNPAGTRNVFRSQLGTGVTETNNPLDVGTNQINGPTSVGETLRLSFNNAVKLTSAVFSRVGLNDSFKLLVNGNTVATSPITGGNRSDTGITTLHFNSSPTSNVFGFTVGDNATINTGYLVRSITVETVAVPEPITIAGMMMGSGFGVLLYRKYRKGAQFSSKLSS